MELGQLLRAVSCAASDDCQVDAWRAAWQIADDARRVELAGTWHIGAADIDTATITCDAELTHAWFTNRSVDSATRNRLTGQLDNRALARELLASDEDPITAALLDEAHRRLTRGHDRALVQAVIWSGWALTGNAGRSRWHETAAAAARWVLTHGVGAYDDELSDELPTVLIGLARDWGHVLWPHTRDRGALVTLGLGGMRLSVDGVTGWLDQLTASEPADTPSPFDTRPVADAVWATLTASGQQHGPWAGHLRNLADSLGDERGQLQRLADWIDLRGRTIDTLSDSELTQRCRGPLERTYRNRLRHASATANDDDRKAHRALLTRGAGDTNDHTASWRHLSDIDNLDELARFADRLGSTSRWLADTADLLAGRQWPLTGHVNKDDIDAAIHRLHTDLAGGAPPASIADRWAALAGAASDRTLLTTPWPFINHLARETITPTAVWDTLWPLLRRLEHDNWACAQALARHWHGTLGELIDTCTAVAGPDTTETTGAS